MRQKDGLNSTSTRRLRSHATGHQRLGDRAGAWPELNHGARCVDIHIAGHGPRQHPAGRRYRSDRQRLLQPGANEPHLVVEAKALFVGEGRLRTHGLVSGRYVCETIVTHPRHSRFRLGRQVARRGSAIQSGRPPSPSKSSFTRAKKPDDSGWVSVEESF